MPKKTNKCQIFNLGHEFVVDVCFVLLSRNDRKLENCTESIEGHISKLVTKEQDLDEVEKQLNFFDTCISQRVWQVPSIPLKAQC